MMVLNLIPHGWMDLDMADIDKMVDQWAVGGTMEPDLLASDPKVQGDLSSAKEEGMVMEKERLVNQSVMVKEGPVVLMVLGDLSDVLTQAVVLMATLMVLPITRPKSTRSVSTTTAVVIMVNTTAAARRMADPTLTTIIIIRQKRVATTIIVTRPKMGTRIDPCLR